MASPTYDDIWRYAQMLQHVNYEAHEAFMRAASSVNMEDAEAAVEQLAQLAMEIIDAYGLAAGELGAQWYEYCREMKYGAGYRAILGQTSRYSAQSDIKSVVGKLVDGKITAEDLVPALAGVISDQVQTSARYAIEENLDIEYKKAMDDGDLQFANEIGYARVTAPGACAFCIMLASRGFVYHNERTATRSRRTGGKYHEHCNCTAVPFHEAHTIKGYGRQLEKNSEMYYDARHLWKSGNMPQELQDRIAAARAAHAEKIANGQAWDRWGDDNEITIVMRWQHEGLK